MLHLDLPTMDQFKRLSQTRADACVSIYLETTPLSQDTDAARIELGNLWKEASHQLTGADVDKARVAAIHEPIEALIEDDEFWRFQAISLALLATPDRLQTFRLANRLPSQVEVSDRFHLKPLLRAITFPHTAFVLALSEGAVRLVEILPSGAPVEVKVPDLPKDAASAAGRSTLNDRSAKRRIQGSEGQKVLLTQYARKVDAALRPILSSRHTPMFLAGTEPLASIFRSLNSYGHLAPDVIQGSPDRVSDAELTEGARTGLDRLYAAEVSAFAQLFAECASQGRTTTDLSEAARAATYGAVEAIAVDIDEAIPGVIDETTGVVTLASAPGKDSYGVVDEIAGRALGTGAKVLGVRKADIPGHGNLAAILRYPI